MSEREREISRCRVTGFEGAGQGPEPSMEAVSRARGQTLPWSVRKEHNPVTP